jgi:D-glycero-alpha-D-manno-heptose-7-phosphate kinase
MLIVRTPVRISFGGGGTDLPVYFERYGGAVLSTAINKYFYTIVGKRTDGHIQIISSDLRISETWNDINEMSVRGTALELPLAVLQDLRCEAAVDIFLASEIPPGTGLGSSASACVNLLQAMATYLQLPFSRDELAEKAFHIASHVLGKPVGKQDEYAAAFGGLNFMTFNQNGTTIIEPLRLETEFVNRFQQKLMLFFTGATHHSWAILKQQETSMKVGKGAAVESLHKIRELAERMRQALLEGNLRELGLLIHESWENKKKISSSISNSSIDKLYQLARDHGAIGGKITGAGGGGFMLLYCDEENQPGVRDVLTAEGIREMRFAFDFNGTRVLVNDPFIEDQNCASQWNLVGAVQQIRLKQNSPG